MCARSGANCGSLFLDLRFRELVRTLLEDHPSHLDAASLAYFMHAFSETDKLDMFEFDLLKPSSMPIFSKWSHHRRESDSPSLIARSGRSTPRPSTTRPPSAYSFKIEPKTSAKYSRVEAQEMV